MAEHVTMPELFPACVRVLRRELRPLHYRTLTNLAYAELGRVRNGERRPEEDVREKLLQSHNRGTFYATPYGVLREWFDPPDAALPLEVRAITIAGSAYLGYLACREALMRSEHMLQKTNAPKERLMQGRASGFAIQQHVTAWLQEGWPELYREASNHGVWTRPARDDCRIAGGGKTYDVDVAGPHLNGKFGPSRGKEKADVHILARLAGRNVEVCGWLPGRWFEGELDAEDAWRIDSLCVFLNCLREGIDYAAISRAVTGKPFSGLRGQAE